MGGAAELVLLEMFPEDARGPRALLDIELEIERGNE